jgi:hypothetical protein
LQIVLSVGGEIFLYQEADKSFRITSISRARASGQAHHLRFHPAVPLILQIKGKSSLDFGPNYPVNSTMPAHGKRSKVRQ